jgi:hypothetical protein
MCIFGSKIKPFCGDYSLSEIIKNTYTDITPQSGLTLYQTNNYYNEQSIYK